VGIETKVCKDCEQNKSMDEFYVLIDYKRKLSWPSSYCKSCSITKATRGIRDFTDKNFLKLWEYLENHPCVDCGADNPLVLSLDHVKEGKTENISNMMCRAKWEKIVAELKLCETRCHNCHAIKTAASRNFFTTDQLRSYITRWKINEEAYEEYKN